MAPGLLTLKGFRRRSRASFKTEQSTDTSDDGSHGRTPTSGSLTPPSIAEQSDPALDHQLSKEKLSESQSLPPVPPVPHNTRPPLRSTTNQSHRHSVSGMTGLGSPSNGGRGPQPQLPTSPYAPQVENIRDGHWVYQKVLLVHGRCGVPGQAVEGDITVTRLDDAYPPIQWPVCGGLFKALIYLQPGMNKLRLEFASPKLENSGSSNPVHCTYLTINMIPPMNAPPLQLAILLAKDSPGTFDASPARAEREGNGLEVAIRKFRMAAYLWQAFTAEQMFRNKLGRRTFRFEEEWTQGTTCFRDHENGVMRSEARIHVIRMDKTLAEIRDLNIAQQFPGAKDKDALHRIAGDAVKKYFSPLPGQQQYVSCMFLDSHWDTQAQTITGHAALGSSSGDLKLAIFGSHSLHSYPTKLEEVVAAFTDCTTTDTRYVANDCNEAGSSWENANIGIGAHLHETGHLFGCPHEVNGVMARDYTSLHRTFLTREAYSTRTKSKGGIVSQTDECTWHRLDCLRFRGHPCFRLPNDPQPHIDDSIQAWPVEGEKVAVTSPSGVAWVEIYGEGDDTCATWLEYPTDMDKLKRQVTFTDHELRSRLPENKRKGKMRVCVKSHSGGNLDIDDFKQLSSKDVSLRIGPPVMGKAAFRSKKLGLSQMEGSQPQEFVFTSALKEDRVLSRIVFYHGAALDGIVFVYDDNSQQAFGQTGNNVNMSVFDMDIRRGEYISGFFVRSGFWIDGIQVLTSNGRRSPFYGNPHGGDGHTLTPPYGYTICGISGSCGQWVDGFSVIIQR